MGELVYNFWLDNIKPMPISFRDCLYYIIKIGQATPSAKWLGYRYGLYYDQADAWWQCMTSCEPAVLLASGGCLYSAAWGACFMLAMRLPLACEHEYPCLFCQNGPPTLFQVIFRVFELFSFTMRLYGCTWG